MDQIVYGDSFIVYGDSFKQVTIYYLIHTQSLTYEDRAMDDLGALELL